MNKLHAILNHLVFTAHVDLEKSKSRILPNGLSVTIKFHKDNTISVGISREDVFPSDTEWETIFKYFPIAIVDPPEPVKEIVGGKYFLHATFSTEKKSIMQLMDELEKQPNE